jgi:spore coat protein SA
MRIAFVNQPWNYCPPIRGGSIAVWTYEVARRIPPRHHVTVYARPGLQPRDEWQDGVRYRRVPSGLDEFVQSWLKRAARHGLIRRPLFSFSSYYLTYIARVAFDLRSEQPDVVHLYNMPHFVSVVRALYPHARIALNMRAEWLTQLDARVWRPHLERADFIIGCSEYITAGIRARFPEYASRTHTVPNGVDVSGFSPPNGKQNGRSASRVLFVGRISPEKGLHVLIEAMRRVVQRVPDALLQVVGREEMAPAEFIVGISNDPQVADLSRFYRGGSYLAALKAQVAQAGLEEHVEFQGFVTPDHISECYRGAAILVNPSYSESFGRALIEAGAVGLPVVASRVGGMPEIIVDGETGLLTPAGDADALAEAIVALLDDGALRRRMGGAGRERAIGSYSWESVADALLRVYEAP